MNNRLSTNKKTVRESGIELLKIAAILLIIVSHVDFTLSTTPIFFPDSGYVIALSKATTDPVMLILAMLRYSGAFGNMLFFLSSAWFLLDRTKNDKGKALQLVGDNWAVSVCFLFLYLALGFRAKNRLILSGLILKSCFPTLAETNWYVNAYVLFLILYPTLNRVIGGMSQKALARASSTLVLIYLVGVFALCFFRYAFGATTFFSSEIIVWIAVYFMIAYMKRYMKDKLDNRRFNIGLTLIGFVGTYGLVLVSNILGLKWALFSESLLIWYQNYNPFNIMMSLGLFNLARSIRFKSALVNYISGLSLYIYIIHENYLARYFLRPAIWNYIHGRFGYRHVLLWTLAQTAVLFVVSALCGILYKYTLHPLVVKACRWLYPKLAAGYHRFENRLLKL